jgi:hypothetical protein
MTGPLEWTHTTSCVKAAQPLAKRACRDARRGRFEVEEGGERRAQVRRGAQRDGIGGERHAGPIHEQRARVFGAVGWHGAWRRRDAPLDWAATQMNLGNALATLGERESGTARLQEAVAAYRDALSKGRQQPCRLLR